MSNENNDSSAYMYTCRSTICALKYIYLVSLSLPMNVLTGSLEYIIVELAEQIILVEMSVLVQ